MIFVDTWAWLALAYKRDPYHAVAVRQHRALRQQNRSYVTTDYVLSELVTSLFRAVAFSNAQQFVERLLQSINDGHYQLVFVSRGQFERAWQMRQRYQDKPDISFVDFTSMVVMQDLGVVEVFTGDTHFQQVGLGFRLVP